MFIREMFLNLLVFAVYQMNVIQATWPVCDDTAVMFTAEPRDVVVGCGADNVAVFPCQYTGSVAHPNWVINSTEYTSVILPPDHSYSSGVLKVSNVNEKNGSRYHCFLLSHQNGTPCAYQSEIGRLILNCKGFNIQSSPSYRYDINQTLKEINTTIMQINSIEDTYNISISYNNSDNTLIMCGSATITSSSCVDGVCNHVFNIQKSSSCPNDTNIIVTAEVFADSSFIKNPEKIRIDAVNSFIQLNFTRMKPLSVSCTFINQPMEGEKVCMIAVRPECKRITYVSEGSVYNSSSVEVVVDDLSMENVKRLCFLLTGSNSTTKVNVEGQYTLSASLMDINHCLKRTTLVSLIVLFVMLFMY